MEPINSRIAQCIVATGLTKTAFAKKINLSQPHISKIALGDSVPSDRTIADICREFNIDETWLRTGEGEMFRRSPDTLAERLSRDYGLDDLGYQIMTAYLKLDENDRAAVGRLIQNLTNSIQAEPPKPQTVEEVEAEYIKTMSELARKQERTALNSTDADTTEKIS